MTAHPTTDARVSCLRHIMLDRISEADIRSITDKLIGLAKEGDLRAARLLFQYTLGKPWEMAHATVSRPPATPLPATPLDRTISEAIHEVIRAEQKPVTVTKRELPGQSATKGVPPGGAFVKTEAMSLVNPSATSGRS